MCDLCFDNVIIRNNNKIGTKCHCCDRLSILRRRSRDYNARLGVSTLFSYHRHMFMSEKRAYHQRMIAAIMHPLLFASVIVDGMDKEKTKLPQLNRVTLFYLLLLLIIKYYINNRLNFRILIRKKYLELSTME